MSFACKAKGEAGTSRRSRVVRGQGRQAGRYQGRSPKPDDCSSHWPFLIIFSYGLPCLCVWYVPTAECTIYALPALGIPLHGSDAAAACCLLLLLLLLLPRLYTRHGISFNQSIPPDRPTSRTCIAAAERVPQSITWQGVERYGRHVTQLNPGPATLNRRSCSLPACLLTVLLTGQNC